MSVCMMDILSEDNRMTTPSYTKAEKQLITTLGWFRSRYALFMGLSLDRNADKESIEQFGKAWIGDFKEDWTDTFISLSDKHIIELTPNGYSLTEYGLAVKNNIDAETPFYKYEYDNYFHMDQQSKAHSAFCEKVYGLDLSQHGLIDQHELSFLLELLKKNSAQKILDIGCGNGKITEWISQTIHTSCVGIDISEEGVRLANQRTKNNPLLHFEIGNINDLHSSELYDAILFLDTLYYSTNIQRTLSQARALLKPDARIYAYFSQWIMDEQYAERLHYNNTALAGVLHTLSLPFSCIDLSESGRNHWKRKLEVLLAMKEDFIAEGSEQLWEYRYREAYRYAHWGDNKYSRYLYEIHIP